MKGEDELTHVRCRIRKHVSARYAILATVINKDDGLVSVSADADVKKLASPAVGEMVV